MVPHGPSPLLLDQPLPNLVQPIGVRCEGEEGGVEVRAEHVRVEVRAKPAALQRVRSERSPEQEELRAEGKGRKKQR